ncbi:MAG: electron transport complex subunit [Oscillospiraceae bacterium]|jgi:electron transport complex protein RnfE|nr:electron transport complex subunit [Oscillospiraceae bacterium]
MNKLSNLTRGIIKENPVLVLLLGTCPTLATSTQAKNAIGMGLAATVVLICSNIAISALRKIIPDKVRIPSYIVVIAGFVTVVQMVVKAYAPALDKSLGIYLPLIVVNCIILGRAEMFASKNGVVDSALDGVGMGIGFTLALLLMATIREIFGAGSWMGIRLVSEEARTISIMGLAPGGFFVFGSLIALVNKLSKGKAIKKKEFGCAGCGSEEACGEDAKGAC